MADLGNLWFSLGLDDSKFDKEWKAAFQKYKNDAKIDVLINVSKDQIKNINDITNALSKVSGIAGKKKAKIDIEVTQRTLDGIKSLKDMGITSTQLKEIRNAAKAVEEYAKHLERAKNIASTGNEKIVKSYSDQALWLQNLRSLAANYLSIYGVKNFVTELATITGEFEKQRITLQAMVGELEGLDIYEKMKELSIESPFQFKDLASYAKQLAAFSVPYNELYDTTKRLADISAGLGVDMSRIILAYGQIKNAGVLRGTELRQLTEAGVPILDKLAKKFEELEGQAVSVGDVFERISKRMVSFEMVKEIFEDLTNEGGKFYNMQQIQAETLAGKISNLKDAYDIMLTEIGEASEEKLKKGVEILYKLIDSWEDVALVLKTVIAAYGAYQAVHILAFSADKIAMVTRMASVMLTYATNLKRAVSLMTKFGMVSKAGVYGAVAAAIAGVGVAIYQSYKMANKFRNELVKIGETQFTELQNETDKLNLLVQAIKNTAEGTEERKELIDCMNNEYGSYISNILKETDALHKVEQAQKDITMALRDRAKEQAFTDASRSITENFTNASSDAVKGMISALENKGFSRTMAVEISGKLREAFQKNPDLTIGDEVVANILSSIEGLDVSKAVDALREKMSFDSGIGPRQEKATWSSLTSLVKAFKTFNKETKEAKDFFTVLYGKSPKDMEEEFNKLTQAYQHTIAQIDLLKLPNADEKKFNAEVTYLNELIKLYALMPSEQQKYIDKLEEITKKTDEWILSAQKAFKDKGVLENFAPKKGDNFLGYIEKMRKDYKEIVDSLKDLQKTDPNGMKPALQARREVYELLAKEWGITLDEKADNKAEQEKLEKQRKEVAKLRNEYDNLLTLYKSFDKFSKEGLTDANIFGILGEKAGKEWSEQMSASLTKEGGLEAWFAATFKNIQDRAIEKGGEFGKTFADSVSRTLTTMDVKDIVDAFKLVGDMQKELAKWGLEDFTLKGEGVTFDISKILREENEANNKVYARRQQLLDQIKKAEKGDAAEVAALKIKYGNDWAAKARKDIEDLTKLEIENNGKVAQDKLAKMGTAYAKQAMEKEFSEDFFSNLGDKTLAQLKETSLQLQQMMDNPSFLKDEAFLDYFGGDTSELEEFIKQWKIYISLTKSDVDIQHFEKVKKKLTDTGKVLSSLVGSLKQLSGESALLDTLGVALDSAMGLADAFSVVKQKNEETGEVTDILKVNWTSIADVALQLASNIIASVAASREYARQMRLAGDEFARSITQSRRELLITGEAFETIFGENLIGALDADNKAISQILGELKRSASEVANMKIKTKQKKWFGGRNEYMTLQDFAPQLFKKDGSVNYEYLDEFLDAYGDKLSDSQKALLEHLKATYEQYENAMSDVNDYLSGIFSDTASTIADRMIDAFAATGDAATALGDMVHEVARQMAKDLVQSLLIEQYLTPAMDKIKKLYDPNAVEYQNDATKRIQQSILLLQDGLTAAESGAAEVNKILQGLADYGIDFSAASEKTTDTLSGLTEDQQNLLMGYINGIRADISINKGMLTSIVNSVGTINNNIAAAIVVWKQIEANTHRSADGVDRIIGFFESVMSPYDGGGGQAFKVNVA